MISLYLNVSENEKMLPIFRSIGVVLEFVVASPPGGDYVLPSWCVQSVEFFLKDESTTQMIKLAPSAFHSVASDCQQQ
jgi:hypothetical protein